MKIILDDKYVISSDQLNYFLDKKKEGKNGEQTEQTRHVGAWGKNQRGIRQLVQRYITERQGSDFVGFEGNAEQAAEKVIRSNIMTAESVARMIEKVIDEKD